MLIGSFCISGQTSKRPMASSNALTLGIEVLHALTGFVAGATARSLRVDVASLYRWDESRAFR
jgi:hypothetical protein